MEGLAAWTHLALAMAVKPPEEREWSSFDLDNDQLDAVLDAIARNGAAASARELWAAVTPARTGLELGVLWYALERVETWGQLEGDEPSPWRRWSDTERAAAARRFFAAAGREGPRPRLAVVEIPAGTFQMGSPEGVGDEDEHPRHEVRLSRPFRMGTTVITNAEYGAFDWAWADRLPREPATEMTWFEARLFAAWVGGRLPTEAEWECACRAGTGTAWSFGDDPGRLSDFAWTIENNNDELHPVATKRSNPWGLCDMHGLVFEWTDCRRLRTYRVVTAVDPSGLPRGGGRVARGGALVSDADWTRSASRRTTLPSNRSPVLGFRVALPSDPAQ